MKIKRPVSRRPRFQLARRKAKELLSAAGVVEAPVPVERIAELAGATIRYEPFAGRLSGLVQRTGRGAVIGVNSMHAQVRRRFTIAHELGHLVLQRDDLFHVDQAFPMAFRSEDSSNEHGPFEVEANQFAAELLMPAELLMRDLLSLPDDIDVDVAIEQLATRYEVSEQAMTVRLSALGVLR